MSQMFRVIVDIDLEIEDDATDEKMNEIEKEILTGVERAIPAARNVHLRDSYTSAKAWEGKS